LVSSGANIPVSPPISLRFFYFSSPFPSPDVQPTCFPFRRSPTTSLLSLLHVHARVIGRVCLNLANILTCVTSLSKQIAEQDTRTATHEHLQACSRAQPPKLLAACLLCDAETPRETTNLPRLSQASEGSFSLALNTRPAVNQRDPNEILRRRRRLPPTFGISFISRCKSGW